MVRTSLTPVAMQMTKKGILFYTDNDPKLYFLLLILRQKRKNTEENAKEKCCQLSHAPYMKSMQMTP
jgi:hypothetical protein